nr:hypothetical protein [Neomicrococcus aestuarii]
MSQETVDQGHYGIEAGRNSLECDDQGNQNGTRGDAVFEER